MHESTASESEQNIGERAIAPLPNESIFAGPPRYPLDGEKSPSPSTAASAAATRKKLTRIVLPMVLFLGGVAVLAWVTQNLPRSIRPPSVIPETPKAQALAQFFGMINANVDPKTGRGTPVMEWASKGVVNALWDPERPEYAREYEIAWGGHVDSGYYDFEVENPTDVPIDLIVLEMSCVCSSVQACMLSGAERTSYDQLKAAAIKAGTFGRQTFGDFTWQVLAKDKHREQLELPAKGAGIVRVFWDGIKKQQPETLTLNVKMGMHAHGASAQELAAIDLMTRVVYVRPIRFYPDQLDAGAIGGGREPARVTLVSWSATRDFSIKADLKTDPCFVLDPKPLTEEECRQLEADLRKDYHYTKVRSGYRVSIAVHEQQGDKQLDLGWLQRRLPLTFASG
ncbi:MAG: hypothetical protein ACRET7_01580, partial [Burkholderiales bacterium]